MIDTIEDPFADMTQPEETTRLRNGRYYYPKPGEEDGPDIAHTRVTTFVKAIADNFALERWKLEQTVLGLTLDESLYLAACATPVDGEREFSKIAAKAQTRAGSDVGSARGTAYHDISDRWDHGCECRTPAGFTSGRVSLENVRAKMLGYRETLAQHRLQVLPDFIERTVYIPHFGGLIGRLDRILFDEITGRYIIGDLKSAKEIWTYSEWAVQLGLYANASHVWDPALQVWEPMPAPLDHDLAVIIWMPRVHPDGNDVVTVEDLKIRRAFEHAARVTAEVRAWRNEGKTLGSRRPLPLTPPMRAVL